MKDRIYKKWMINNWEILKAFKHGVPLEYAYVKVKHINDIVWHDWNENYLDDDYIYRIKK
jgi:hypothetical protein